MDVDGDEAMANPAKKAKRSASRGDAHQDSVDAREVCATGVPTTCDAKCAVFYVDFYDRCRDYINLQNTPTAQTSLAQLHTTCGQALPVEPLLLAAARCSGWTPGSATPATPAPTATIVANICIWTYVITQRAARQITHLNNNLKGKISV